MLPLSVWLLPLVVTEPAVSDAGALCPAPAAIEARVRAMVGLASDDVMADRALVHRERDQLKVTLVGRDQRIIGERLLSAEGTCDELAGVVAVVLATWLSDERHEFVGPLPSVLAPQAPDGDGTADSNAPDSAGGTSSRAPSPTSTARVAHRDAVASRADHEDATSGSVGRWFAAHRWTLGLSLGLDLANGEPRPLGTLEARWISRGAGVGAFVSAVLSTPRTEPLGTGTGNLRYWRWPLALGPVIRVPIAAASLELAAGGALAWVHLAGSGFEVANTYDRPVGGALAAVRLVGTRGPSVQFFADTAMILWPKSVAYLQPVPNAEVTLPQTEFLLSVGAAWCSP